MGTVDDFVRAQIGPHLRPDEQILGVGLVRKPSQINVLGVPQHYDDWLAASTNKRLLLFETETSGMLDLTAKPVRGSATEEWVYADLREVAVQSVNGIGSGRCFFLQPHDGLGPREGKSARWDVFPHAKHLDGHAEFYRSFPQWLQGGVAGGAFPMDDARRAELAALAAHRAAIAAAEQQKRAENAAKQRETIARVGRGLRERAVAIGGGVAMVAAGVCFAVAAYYVFTIAGRWQRELERDEKLLAEATSSVEKSESKKNIARDEQYLFEDHVVGGAWAGGGLVLLIGGAIALRIGLRKPSGG